jgi:hypothetical protein
MFQSKRKLDPEKKLGDDSVDPGTKPLGIWFGRSLKSQQIMA